MLTLSQFTSQHSRPASRRLHQSLVDDLLARGRLETIPPDYARPQVQLNMLIVPDRTNIARVRMLIDYLVDEAVHVPGIEKTRLSALATTLAPMWQSLDSQLPKDEC